MPPAKPVSEVSAASSKPVLKESDPSRQAASDAESFQSGQRRPFHVMAKPIGARCNLDCHYCYYLEKEQLYPGTRDFRMSEATLERFIADYITAQPGQEVDFMWQGGEPTLLGLDYFRRIVALQQRHAGPKVVRNALQTNGTLLNDAWGRFLADERFLVGVSIDGPSDLHDAFRQRKGGGPSFEAVIRGLECLARHRVDFNTLTVVNALNVQHPLAIYRFLREVGSGFIQFLPAVDLSASWTVGAADYGRFLITVFEEWVRHDVGQVFVQLFDVTLANFAGVWPGLCLFMEDCGEALAVEHNGDLYSCDHYVRPSHRLGNLNEQRLGDMARSARQRDFGKGKSASLPGQCRRCEVRFACHGECPKNRVLTTADGEPGLNYLCEGYRAFFNHVRPAMEEMLRLLREGRPPAEIMRGRPTT